MVYQALFIALALIVIKPFRCYDHPNGKNSSLVAYPDVICGESDHVPLILFGLMGMFVYIFAFLVFYAIKVVQVPKLLDGSPDMALRYKFIVFRFRAGAWWWSLVFLIRNVFIACSTLLDPDYPISQMVYLLTVVQIFMIAQCHIWPWRTVYLNLLDATVSVCITGMTVAAAPLTAQPDSQMTDQATFFVTFFVALAFSVTSIVVGQSGYEAVKGMIDPSWRNSKEASRSAKLYDLSKKTVLMWKALTYLSEDEVHTHLMHMGPLDLKRYRQMLFMTMSEWLEVDSEAAMRELGAKKKSIRRLSLVRAPVPKGNSPMPDRRKSGSLEDVAGKSKDTNEGSPGGFGRRKSASLIEALDSRAQGIPTLAPNDKVEASAVEEIQLEL